MKAASAIGLALALLAGCGNGTEGEEASFPVSLGTVPEGKKALASWEDSGMVMPGNCALFGDTLYYMEARWDNEAGRQTDALILRKRRGERETEEAVVLEEDAWLLAFFLDESEALYCFYGREAEEPSYYLKKVSPEGNCIYDMVVSGSGESQSNAFKGFETVFAGAADREGRVCLADTGGGLYLFDTEGKLTGTATAPWSRETYHGSRCGLTVGPLEIFAYLTEGREVKLSRVDMEDGLPQKEVSLRPDEQERPGGPSLAVYSGYGQGIFLSDSDALWRYEPNENTLTELLRWRDSDVGMGGYQLGALGVLPEEALYLLTCQSYLDTAFVQIDFGVRQETSERRTVTLSWLDYLSGSGTAGKLEEMTGAFNRVNGEFQVELEAYASAEALHMALVKGEGPDVVLNAGGNVLALADKGVLEDLTPYFAESSIVGEDDLLPAVRAAGITGGEWVCVFPTFCIYGVQVQKGTTDRGAWLPEEYVALGESHPDAAMYHYFGSSARGEVEYYNHILWAAIRADMDSYIDWDKKECRFDREEFVDLLDRIKGLQVPAQAPGGEITVHSSADALSEAFASIPEKFEQGEILTFESGVRMHGNTGSEEYGEMAGYPNRSGSPRYRMDDSGVAFSINSASGNKEGAWTFLEYLLSEEYQSGLGTCPVRRDAFDRYLDFSGMLPGSVRAEKLTEETKANIRYMAEHMYWQNTEIPQDYAAVITEEAGAVWSGDRTAREAAENIQNRISLSLSQ